jgi:hypothetical protein
MECWANDTSGAERKKLATRTIASPISRMRTSVEDGRARSLAERHDAHQRPGLDEHRGAGPARAIR